jgi:hypothetical protein
MKQKGSTSKPAASPARPQVDPAFVEYVRALNDAVRMHLGQFASAGELAKSAQASLPSARSEPAAITSVPAAAAAAVPAPPASSLPAEQEDPAFAPLAAAWPLAKRAELVRLCKKFRAVCEVWDPPSRGSDELMRTWRSVVERRDAAVRYFSAAFYATCRDVGIPDEVIDSVAVTLARTLSLQLFGDVQAIYVVPRGMLIESEHELIGSVDPSGRIRGVTFGIRTAGRVSSKASVEADAAHGRWIR